MTKNKTTITAEYGERELMITREFDAPCDLVFRAYTDPKLYAQWLAPRRFAITIDIFEPVNGGSWRYIHKDPEGNEYRFHGVFQEVLAPDPANPSEQARIISTFEFEGLLESGHATLDTTIFEVLPDNHPSHKASAWQGRTKLTVRSVFQSVEDRDGILRSGMERGINDSYSRLDEVLRAGYSTSDGWAREIVSK